MEVYTEKNFGADADNNRGISATFIDLDPTDEPAIKEALQKLIDNGEYESFDDMPEKVSIYLYCDQVGDEVEFEVYPKDHR